MAFDINKFLQQYIGEPEKQFTPIQNDQQELFTRGTPATIEQLNAPTEISKQIVQQKPKNIIRQVQQNIETLPTIESQAQPIIEEPKETYQDRLNKAMESRDKDIRNTLFIEGLGKLANYLSASASGQKPVEIGSNLDVVRAMADKRVADVSDLEASQMNDPKSQISEEYRKAAKQAGIEVPETLSATTLKSMLPALQAQKKMEQDQKQFERQQQLAMMRMAQAQNQEIDQRDLIREKYLDLAKEKKIEGEAEKLSQRIDKATLPKAINALSLVDNALSKYGLSVGGKAKGIDIPSIGILDRLKPNFLLTENDKQLKQSLRDLGNAALKALSGSAVSDQEALRFATAFGEGKFEDEASIMEGLRRIKDELMYQSKNIEVYSPEVKTLYKERTGLKLPSEILESLGTYETKVKIITPAGSVKLIPSNKVQDALSAGGKLVE